MKNDKRIIDLLRQQSEYYSNLAKNDLKNANRWLFILAGLFAALFFFGLNCF